MEQEIKMSDITDQLTEIKTGLENRVDEKTQKLRSDLDITIKAFDRLQINLKQRKGSILSNERTDLKSDISSAIDAALPQLETFIAGKDESVKELKFQVKSTTLTGSYSGGTAGYSTAPTQIQSGLSASAHVRDLLNTIPMSSGILPVIKSTGASGDGFETVSEGAQKPSIDFALSETPAKAQVIATVLTVSKQFMEDLGPRGVQQWLQDELTFLYLIAEDGQLLNGNGISPNLPGLNIAGGFTAATSTSTNGLQKLVETLIQMKTMRRNPTAILLSPFDLGFLLLNTASGSGEFNVPIYVEINPTGAITIAGVPVVVLPSQTPNRFNIIDNSQMVMGIREAFNIRIFEQDSTNVSHNLLTVRAESRVAFSVYNTSAVIQGYFEAGS